MDFKKSFEQLKKPKVVGHYIAGTILIIFVLKYIYDLGWVTLQSSTIIILLTFFIVYVIVDRTIHGVLD